MIQTLPLLPAPSVPAIPAYSPSTGRSRAIDRSRERRASGGDRDALAALLREHAPAIKDVCRFVAGPQDAGDATQEALERIVSSIDRYRPERGAFRSWALTVARNVCRDRLRRRGLERRTFVDDGDEVTDWTASGAPGPERVALARVETARLTEALDLLPEGQRLAVVLYHVHEATYEEIASTLDCPMGTVMTWLHRGRKKLRAALAEGGAAEGGAR